MRRRNEQYTHGRFRKYVQMKKRNMKMGEAFVGINSRGSQLEEVNNGRNKLDYNITFLNRTCCLFL
jgi:hypothetical protein